jgi:hypothetical protein
MPRTPLAPLRCACLVLLLAGCNEFDPYNRAGMWQPSGANAINVAVMVQNPSDLLRGRGTAGSPGIQAGPAVARLWDGKSVALPSTSSEATGAGQGRAGATAGGTN